MHTRCFTSDAADVLDALHADGWDVRFDRVAFCKPEWVVAKLQTGIWRIGKAADLFEAAKLARDEWK